MSREYLGRGAAGCGAILLGIACSAGRAPRDGTPLNLSVGVAREAVAAQVANLLTRETLILIGSDGRALPRLAERWESSEDGRVWRFFLRRDVRFSDDAPLTAAVVRDRLLQAVRDRSFVGPSFLQVSSIEADGENIVVIRLGQPSSLLPLDLIEVDIIRENNGRILTTGPFYQESVSNDVIVLRRFTRHHGGTPAIERLQLRQFETVRKAWTAMMRGEVDFLYEVGPDAADFVENESSVQTFSFLRAYALALGFNLRHPVLRSRSVRQALNRAIDRDALVRLALRGRGRPAAGPLWPEHWAFSAAVPTYTFNPDAAELGLAAAGYKDVIDHRAGRMPSRFHFRCLVYPALERVALIVQKQLFDLGVDMRIDLAPLREVATRVARGEFEAFLLWQNSGRSLTWPYLFWHSPEEGRSILTGGGYTSADSSLDQIRYARDEDEVRNAVAALQQVMYDDPPAIFLAWEQRLRAVSRKFYVPDAEPGRDIVAGIARWRPADDVSAMAR